ncbi:MAG: DUF349 domain-containing protein, partial [Methylococcales bacterium]|nr:DUF349 domain-containing protein [Methylococcales bacterium]
QDIFYDIAIHDTDKSVQTMAIEKINNLDVLGQLITQQTHKELLAEIQNRLNSLLSGQAKDSPSVSSRQQFLESTDNQNCLDHSAQYNTDNQHKKIAIDKINRQGFLGDLVLSEQPMEIRLYCLEKISQKSTLERIVKETRKKDKKTYRISKEKLNNIIEEEERPVRLQNSCKKLCQSLEKLHQRQYWLEEKNTYIKLKEQWTEIKDHATDEQRQQFTNLCEKIDNAIIQSKQALSEQQDHDNIRQQKEFLCNTLENLLADIQHKTPEEIDNNSLESSLRITQQSWSEIVSLKEPEEQNYQQKYQQLVSSIQQSQSHSKSQQKIITQMQLFCNEIEAHPKHQQIITTDDIKQFQRRWKKLSQKIEASFLASYQKRYNHAIKTLETLAQEHKIKQDKIIKEIQSQIPEAQQYLKKGELQSAKNCFKQIKANYAIIKKIDRKILKNISTDISDIQSKLNDLSGWQNWASANERENLCIQAEAIATSSGSPEEIAEQIKILQNKWKKLKGNSPNDLWERFSLACNTAYEPCKQYFQEQSQQRQNNLEQKKLICTQLEHYIDNMDWTVRAKNGVDWKTVELTIQQAKKEWKSIAPIDRKDQKNIEQRFHAILDKIYAKMREQWDRNYKSKYKLIEQIGQALTNAETNLEQSIEDAKKYQSDWKAIGSAGNKHNNKLWNQFRAITDKIFEYRNKEKEAQKSAYANLQEQRINICQSIKELSQSTDDETLLASQFHDMKNQWDELNSQHKEIKNKFEKKYESACADFEKQHQQRQLKQQTMQLEQLIQQSDICREIESNLKQSLPFDDNQPLIEQWQKLASLSLPAHEKISMRYQSLIDSQQLTSIDENIILNNNDNLKLICLKLEIILGIDSPNEEKNKRMELQVSRLSEAMKNTSDNNNQQRQECIDLIKEYTLTGQISTELTQQIKPRINNILQHFKAKYI